MIIEPFAGPGGWDEGAKALGVSGIIGIEHDVPACRTRVAAGHLAIRADAATVPLDHLRDVDGLIASPPCSDYSTAGKGAGVDGETGRLIFEVPRFVEALRPRWVACEQVPPALVWWERFAHDFTSLGYQCWVGILNAADYGVPQTRQRAFLLASLDRQPCAPVPSHTRYPMPGLFGDDMLPWVSMADALGWNGFEAQYKRGAGMTERHGPRPARDCAEPAPTLTGSALGAGAGAKVSFVRTGSVQSGERGTRHEQSADEPSTTVTTRADLFTLHTNRGQDEHGNRQTRTVTEPAPSLTGKAGPQWEWGDGTTDGNAMGQGIKLTVEDALTLQSFRPDYPVQGTKSKQFEQIGNAVPPILAAAVLRQVL